MKHQRAVLAEQLLDQRERGRSGGDALHASEEPELLRAVADEQILGLLVVVEHHLVILAADARLLVAAERRVRRVGVVAVGPHAAGLDGAAHAVGAC